MALRGSLKDFSLPDVFQLIQLSGKTGVLRIRREGAEGAVWFRDGDVFFAQSNWHRELLGHRLVAAGRITPSALAKALEIRREEPVDGRRLGAILVDEGFIAATVLEAFVQEQIQDTIFDLMRWDDGEFDFEVLPQVLDEDIGLAVSIENIVMEGSRRIEEWNRIRKKVPSTDMVFKMATAPGEGTFEIALKPSEWNLLLRLDGTRSVGELSASLGKTDFEVARIVYGLFSAGLLEVATDDEVAREKSDRARRHAGGPATLFSQPRRQPSVPGGETPVDLSGPKETGEAPTGSESAPGMVVSEGPAPEAIVEPQEVPTFLTVTHVGDADDRLVFDQMIEAVLRPHVPSTVAAAPESEPALSEPEVTAEPPAPAPAPGEPRAPGVPDQAEERFVTPVEAESTPEPTPLIEEAPPTTESAPPLEAEAPAASATAAPSAPAESGKTWVSYGSPAGGQAVSPEISISDEISEEVVDTLTEPEDGVTDREPGDLLQPTFTPSGDLEADLISLGLGEMPPELLERVPEPLQEAEVEPAAAAEPTVETSADEIEALLASLAKGDESPATGSAVEVREPAPPAEIAVEPSIEATEGYISTDAFLEALEPDATLASGLGDEIAALTGGAQQRSRPVAMVNRLPEPGSGTVLRRDAAVDKTLLRAVIDGVEKL